MKIIQEYLTKWNLFAVFYLLVLKKNDTFAVESSQGIRFEGMTTLSRYLDSSPKVSVPGWLYFFSVMQYWTYSFWLFWWPTRSLMLLKYRIII